MDESAEGINKDYVFIHVLKAINGRLLFLTHPRALFRGSAIMEGAIFLLQF